MADDSNASVPSQEPSASAAEATGWVKPPTSWVLPLITAVVLASAFCLYYFVYVAARREYLANRNFRSLAVLGDQVQAMVTMHSGILEFSAHLADPHRDDDHGKKEDLEKFVVVRPEDESLSKEERDPEALKDYLKYLAPGFALTDKKRAGQSRLEVQRRNGRWELVLTAHKHEGSHKNYVGYLELSRMLGPLVPSLPFDDILLVSKDGTIVYQSQKAGPQFTTLTGLLQAQPEAAEAKPEAAASEQSKPQTNKHSKDDVQNTSGHEAVGQNTDKTWQVSSKHLTDIQLAGTRYKLFLQPVVLDVYSDEDEGQDEPAQEWVLCGLRSAKTLEWEALSISSTFMVWLTALFLAIFMSSPLLKVLFMNHRQHLGLREVGWLSSSLVLLAIVFTLSGLNALGFPLNDDTEEQLEKLGHNLSNNIHDELESMRKQLVNWCKSTTTTQSEPLVSLQGDLGTYKKEKHKVIRSYDPKYQLRKHQLRKDQVIKLQSPSEAKFYPYLNNVFWTDDDGQQIVKWGASRYLTPMIDISQYPLFRHPESIYLDRKGPPFHFDSVIPTNKVEYLAALTIRTEDCNGGLLNDFPSRSDLTGGIAVLTAQPLSLIDPILPYGYGFALLDDKGVVLFHSDKTKNLHENFLQETDWNQQLQAAMFGHSNPRSLLITYAGRDYQARVLPIPSVSQAQWSLVVYRDLASVRTLNLQAIIMAATLLLVICVLPAAGVAIWALILRPRFAPEWLWPNQGRMLTYVYQIVVNALLVVLFLFLGFTGSSEQQLIACAAIPYTAFLLTVWSIRAYAPGREKLPARKVRRSYSWLIVISIVGVAVFVLIWRTHLPAFTCLVAFGAVAIVPLLDPLRRYLVITSKRYFRRSTASEQSRGAGLNLYSYRGGYILSVVMLLLLVGVLVPAALFRTSLNIERRLTLKQAQLHLASALDQRLISTKQRCATDQLGCYACEQFRIAPPQCVGKNGPSENESTLAEQRFERPPWSQIVLDPMFPDNGSLLVSPCLSRQYGSELYSHRFQGLIYWFHHDYNQIASETLGMISDHVDIESGYTENAQKRERVGKVAEWFWENDGSKLTLRWHGIHVPSKRDTTPDNHDDDQAGSPPRQETGQDPQSVSASVKQSAGTQEEKQPENDLLITFTIPSASWGNVFAGVGIAMAVIAAIGLMAWGLARKIFLFHIDPLKITGAMRVAELIREGRNVAILVPPVSDWKLKATTWPFNLRQFATGPKWAQDLDLDTIPVNTVIEILHFEYNSGDPELDAQKFILLDRLAARKNTQIAVIMTVTPSSEDYGRMFQSFEVVDLREEPFYWLKLYEGPAQDLIWRECGPMPALWPIGAQLARDIKGENIHSEETIASEILERADGYYRLVWNECSSDQKFVLAQLAEDGLLNPTNERAIRQLVRKGVIKADPQFRLMNESFRRFVRSATTAGLKQEWLRESRRSGWGKMHGVFFTTMILLGAFLLTTQNALWQSSAAYVTTALGALGTLFKLFNTYRGGSTEKAG